MREKNDWLQALEDDDLEMLTEFMDFLPFDPGMELITKGEEASWCGIIAEGTVDVVIGGNVVASMPAGKLLGGVSLYKGGKRSVDCAGGENGGVIAALAFDKIKEMEEEAPSSAFRMYNCITVGELNNLQSRLGELKKPDEGEEKKKKKKKKKDNVTEKAKKEVLYRSKAAANARKAKELKAKQAQMEANEKKAKMKSKNEKLARKKLEREIRELRKALEDVQNENDEMKAKMETVSKLEEDLETSKAKVKKLKSQLKSAKNSQGDDDQHAESLAKALAELAALKKENEENRQRRLSAESKIGSGNVDSSLLDAEKERADALSQSLEKERQKLESIAAETQRMQLQLDEAIADKKKSQDLLKELRIQQNDLEERLREATSNSQIADARLKKAEAALSSYKTKNGIAKALAGEWCSEFLAHCIAGNELKRVFSEKRATLEAELATVRENFAAEMQSLREQSLKDLQTAKKEMEDLKRISASDLKSVKDEAERAMADLRQQLTTEHSHAIAALREEMKAVSENLATSNAELIRVQHSLTQAQKLIEEKENTLSELTNTLAESSSSSKKKEEQFISMRKRQSREVARTLQCMVEFSKHYSKLSKRRNELESAFGPLAQKGRDSTPGLSQRAPINTKLVTPQKMNSTLPASFTFSPGDRFGKQDSTDGSFGAFPFRPTIPVSPRRSNHFMSGKSFRIVTRNDRLQERHRSRQAQLLTTLPFLSPIDDKIAMSEGEMATLELVQLLIDDSPRLGLPARRGRSETLFAEPLRGMLPMVEPEEHRIVVIDDNDDTRQQAVECIQKFGYTVAGASCIEDLMREIDEGADLIVCRASFPGGGPAAVVSAMEAREDASFFRVPVVSSFYDNEERSAFGTGGAILVTDALVQGEEQGAEDIFAMKLPAENPQQKENMRKLIRLVITLGKLGI
eukprot:g4443.t1